MPKITTLIVDDEEDGRNSLRSFLEEYCPDVLIVGEAVSVGDAEQKINILAPELVFLDINMPGQSGFTLFELFPSPRFRTIFVTAYDEWAVQAIKHHALDYILKPINIAELIAAVGHAKEIANTERTIQNLNGILEAIHKPPTPEKIPLPVLDGFVYVYISDIVRCEAEGSYTYFHFTNRPKLLVCRILGSYEDQLNRHGFIRVHHHHLINMAHIEKYQRGRGGIVLMSDKSEVIVSQRKKDDFLKELEKRL